MNGTYLGSILVVELIQLKIDDAAAAAAVVVALIVD
jgi:hypothetical protein